jgi:hypothetical protein
MKDKDLIAGWLRLYNLLNKTNFLVIEWPDQQDRTQKAIDALCEDDSGNRLAIEHTLIQPFVGEKEDNARFLQTLASLENDPRLIVPGYTIHASQGVGSVPSGFQWSEVSAQLLKELAGVLPSISEGISKVDISVGKSMIQLTIDKYAVQSGQQPSFSTARIWPGEPGPALILKALKAKVPKLAAYANAIKILLLEKDSVAGTIESQFEQLPQTEEVKELLRQIDAIWIVRTAGLDSGSEIFTNDVWPSQSVPICSLDLITGKFWQVTR